MQHENDIYPFSPIDRWYFYLPQTVALVYQYGDHQQLRLDLGSEAQALKG